MSWVWLGKAALAPALDVTVTVVPALNCVICAALKVTAWDVRKVLESAAANADHNNGMRSDDLVLSHVTVDPGPTIKRFRPRAQGRATPIMKRTSHITIGLTPAPEGGRRRGK